ncbi:Eco57I restriction-modification methylase domain-containing protein [Mesoplasma photuris]|uniref:Eco57I restriction-modification methylase domain-containing protein n=1 Tax=Mesoplasma photuris TaxID=217731 RepID=UPI0004E16731|nr:Eco57I restriction-modification methylase domain-containing protein [Mesoplasma photuris]
MKEFKKELGQTFTPENIVNQILDEGKFISSEKLFLKKVMEPSFGDGAFLIKIVERVIESSKKNKMNSEEIENAMNNNIFGYEIDEYFYNKTKENLNVILEKNLLSPIEWKNLKNSSTYEIDISDNSFDYVFGNPPYIRIQNISEKDRKIIKNKFCFVKKGNIDSYLVFFEIGIKILNEKGILGYITPNSYLRNRSAFEFKRYLLENNLLTKIIDFDHTQIFEGVTSYTAITMISKNKGKDQKFIYKNMSPYRKAEFNLNSKNLNWDEKWIFGLNNKGKTRMDEIVDIKYGIATLRDKIFIANGLKSDGEYTKFNNFEIESSIIKKIVKGTKNSENKIVIFPYEIINKVYVKIPESKFKKHYPKAYKYLLSNKKELLIRDIDSNSDWYLFGRSQGIKNMNNKKIVINNMIKDKLDFSILNDDEIVYSGIFLTVKDNTKNINEILEILKSDKIVDYLKKIGKPQRGEYVSFSSNDLKEFLF